MRGLQAGLAVAVLGVAGLAGAWFGGRPMPPPPVEVLAPGPAPDEGSITVHVSGAVAAPGMVVLADGSRVGAALAAAGGALGDADLGAVNLAAPLRDGERVLVPRRRSGGAEAAPAAAAEGPVRLNEATAAELEDLPGIGPVLAARIVSHREANGPFREVEDLLDVSGIGEAKLSSLRDLVAVP